VGVGAGGPLFVLVGGGARSGKSRYALARAASLGARRLFVATAEWAVPGSPPDAEMQGRIARHRAERADSFETCEEPVALPAALDAAFARGAHDVVLVDCLTLWLSNLVCRGAGEADVLARVDELRAALARRRAHVVLVTNEVGMGLVPETPLGRLFRDVAGAAHQRLAREADEVHVALLGLLLRVHPAPLAVTTL
jgi:adenosylcobinamide kinase/adenosylcobinamide-phosphate guanylyltransferase